MQTSRSLGFARDFGSGLAQWIDHLMFRRRVFPGLNKLCVARAPSPAIQQNLGTCRLESKYGRKQINFDHTSWPRPIALPDLFLGARPKRVP